MSRNAYLNDKVYYCEDSGGHIFLTTPESPIPEGFIRLTAETVPDIERVWKRLDQQERRRMERMNEEDFKKREAQINAFRSRLHERMKATDCSPVEKDMIRYSLDFLQRKQDALYKNSVYGVAKMQESEAPLAPTPAPAPKVTVPDA